MADQPRNGAYLTRPSYRAAAEHQFDDLINNGYDWRSNSLKRSLSGYILSDSKRRDIIDRMQVIVAYIVDRVSDIKKTINYTVDPKYKYLN